MHVKSHAAINFNICTTGQAYHKRTYAALSYLPKNGHNIIQL